MQYELNIFPKFFTSHDKRTDSNKDVNGKGTLERFTEIVGKDLDENIMPLLDNLLLNIYPHDTAFDRYIPYLESMFGFKYTNWNLYLSSAISMRRNVLAVIHRLHSIRGSYRGYEVCFSMLGMTIVLTEHPAGYGFDSIVTLDDVNRTFDSNCPTCSDYSLDLTGTITITPAVLQAIASIIEFNEPINARLRSLTYNGSPISITFPDFNNDFNYDFFI